MRFLKSFLIFLGVLIAFNAFAEPKKILSVTELVDQYYAAESFNVLSHARPPNQCHPAGPSCAEVACSKLGAFGCDDINEIREVNQACRGNYDGVCLNSACDKLGSFDCDDMHEVQAVARACVGNYDDQCLNSVCARLGRFGCDDLHEIQEVLRTCAGN